jgi:hypothetical protein
MALSYDSPLRHNHEQKVLTFQDIQSDTKKPEVLKNPTRIEEIQQKNVIDRN